VSAARSITCDRRGRLARLDLRRARPQLGDFRPYFDEAGLHYLSKYRLRGAFQFVQFFWVVECHMPSRLNPRELNSFSKPPRVIYAPPPEPILVSTESSGGIEHEPELTWEQECRQGWDKDDETNTRWEQDRRSLIKEDDAYRAHLLALRAADRAQDRPWLWTMRVVSIVECLTLLGILIVLLLR
jgi:hypothetical protein